MKKNTMLRIASVLLVAVLMTTCVISGTFAKYITTQTGTDSARVARWGFDTSAALDLDMFKTTYKSGTDDDVVSTTDVIAPGTEGAATFTFQYNEGGTDAVAAPEVAYELTVDITGSAIAADIKNNANITWKLDSGAYGTWDDLMVDILELSGATVDAGEVAAGTTKSATATYGPGTLPANFADTHTISWKWEFVDTNEAAMGNKAELDEVTITITITATQIDDYDDGVA